MVDRDGTPSLTETPVPAVGFLSGLSGKLLLVTAVFVLIAEVLIFVPSVANMRLMWLRDRLNTAAAAAVVIEGLPDQELPRPVQEETLLATGTKAIVLKKQDASRMVAAVDMPPSVDAQYDLSDVSTLGSLYDAFDTLLFGGDRVIRVYGPVGQTTTRIELLLDEGALRRAMLHYARNVFIFSMLMSLATASPIFFALNRLLIRPMRRMTANIREFATDPSNPARVLEPSGGRDEIAVAGIHLAAMQQTLQRTLKEQKNLADLGLAVSKINHDMRNILSSAQLMSDRLSDVDDPVVKRVAPSCCAASTGRWAIPTRCSPTGACASRSRAAASWRCARWCRRSPRFWRSMRAAISTSWCRSSRASRSTPTASSSSASSTISAATPSRRCCRMRPCASARSW